MRLFHRLLVSLLVVLATADASAQSGTPGASPTGEAGMEAVRARIRQIRGGAAPAAPIVIVVSTAPSGLPAAGSPSGRDGADGLDGRDGVAPAVSGSASLPGVVYVPAQAPVPGDTARAAPAEGREPPEPVRPDVDSSRVLDAERALLDTGLFRAVGVNFAFGRATLIDGADRVLDAVGAVLRRHPDLRVEVGGHTDAIGSEAANQRLSERRAETVRAYLIERWGIAPERLTATGYGEARPASADVGETGRALNRRVEFAVTGR